MRSRSITGPLILVAIGVFFLIYNLRPDLISFARIANYWPFLLIAMGVIGLIEVLFHASRSASPPAPPFSGAGIFWILVLAFLLSLAGRAHNFTAFQNFRARGIDATGIGIFGSDYSYDVHLTEPAQGLTHVVLDNVRGNLSLKGAEPGTISVTGRKTVRAFDRNDADRADRQTQVHMDRQGDSLVIHADDSRGPRLFPVNDDLEIAVPKGVSVESRGRIGDLTVDEVDGPVDVSAGRGDIRLSRIGSDVRIQGSRSGEIHAADVKGGVDLQGRGGDVQLENIEGPVTINGEYDGLLDFRALAKPMHFSSSRTEFSAEAVPGSIAMDLGDLKLTNVAGPVRFKTGTRDIQASEVTEGLDLAVNRGDIQIAAGKGPLPKMDVHTRNGDISLSLPGGSAFQLDGSTSRGDVENQYGGELKTHASGHGATISGGAENGPVITVGTGRGTILVKKI